MTGQTTKVAVPMGRDEIDLARCSVGGIVVSAGGKNGTLGEEVLEPDESVRGTGDCRGAELDAEIALQRLHLLLPDLSGGCGGDARATAATVAAIGLVEAENVADVVSLRYQVFDRIVERHVVLWVLRCSPQHRDELELAIEV